MGHGDFASMPELISKLAEREKERLAAEQEATAGIRACQGKVGAASQEFMELKRAKEQEFMVLRAQHEKRMRDTAYAWRQKMHKAEAEVSEAVAMAERAEHRRFIAEGNVNVLRQRIHELEAHLQKRAEVSEQKLASLNRLMDSRVRQLATQSQQRIQAMTEHAQGAHSAAGAAVTTVQQELQDQLAAAHLRAEGRTRFKELCDLAKRAGNYDMSEASFQHLKAELLSLWTLQTTSHSPRLLASPRGQA